MRGGEWGGGERQREGGNEGWEVGGGVNDREKGGMRGGEWGGGV